MSIKRVLGPSGTYPKRHDRRVKAFADFLPVRRFRWGRQGEARPRKAGRYTSKKGRAIPDSAKRLD